MHAKLKKQEYPPMSPTLFHECLFHLLSVLVGTAASWSSSLTSCYYIISFTIARLTAFSSGTV